MEKYLVHYGIKGQKRGVRRWTNADGTLTEAGKKRYYDDSNGNDYKPGKFVDERTNYTPTRHYMQYMSDHGGTSGKINTGKPTYYSPTEYDRGRNNREEQYRRDNWYADRKNVDSLNRRIRSTLPGDSIIQGPVGSQEFRSRQKEIKNKQAEGGNQAFRRARTDLSNLNKKDRSVVEKTSLPEGGYRYDIYRDNKVSSRLDEYRKRQAARESTLQAPGSDRMERANIADSKGPYMSKEYREELAYNSQKNQYPSGATTTARSEKSNQKKGPSDYDWWENTATEKQRQQIYNNSDRAYNQKAAQEDPDKKREWAYNPSKDISSNHKGGYYSTYNKNDKSFHPYGEKSDSHGNETPASSSKNNPARYGKNDTATTARKSTTTASTTVSTASKSSSLQKGINFIKKLFSK